MQIIGRSFDHNCYEEVSGSAPLFQQLVPQGQPQEKVTGDKPEFHISTIRCFVSECKCDYTIDQLVH